MAKPSRQELLDAVAENTPEGRRRRRVMEDMFKFVDRYGDIAKVPSSVNQAFTALLGSTWHQPHTWPHFTLNKLNMISELMKTYKK